MKLWIAKDLSEELILFKEQPSYNNRIKMWMGGGLPIGKLNGYSFPELTFENSPKRIKIELMED
jgi:hypothetical protein